MPYPNISYLRFFFFKCCIPVLVPYRYSYSYPYPCIIDYHHHNCLTPPPKPDPPLPNPSPPNPTIKFQPQLFIKKKSTTTQTYFEPLYNPNPHTIIDQRKERPSGWVQEIKVEIEGERRPPWRWWLVVVNDKEGHRLLAI